MRSIRYIFLFVAGAFAAMGAGANVAAQEFSFCEEGLGSCGEADGKGRIGLMAGSARGTYIKIADDIKKAIDAYQKENSDARYIRVVPTVGYGSIRNIQDILFFKNTDIGLVQADVLDKFKSIAADIGGNNKYRVVEQKIRYLAKVYNEEVHVVCRVGACGSVFGENAATAVINLGVKGSGNWLTAAQIAGAHRFPAKNLRYMGNKRALAALLSDPDSLPEEERIDGMILVAGKPVSLFDDVKEAGKVELVPLSDPRSKSVYLSAKFVKDDYPNMVSDADIPTLSVPALLAVYDFKNKQGDRYRNLVAFCEALIAQSGELREGAMTEPRKYHPKWELWKPSGEIAGWDRHPAMTEALKAAGLK